MLDNFKISFIQILNREELIIFFDVFDSYTLFMLDFRSIAFVDNVCTSQRDVEINYRAKEIYLRKGIKICRLPSAIFYEWKCQKYLFKSPLNIDILEKLYFKRPHSLSILSYYFWYIGYWGIYIHRSFLHWLFSLLWHFVDEMLITIEAK